LMCPLLLQSRNAKRRDVISASGRYSTLRVCDGTVTQVMSVSCGQRQHPNGTNAPAEVLEGDITRTIRVHRNKLYGHARASTTVVDDCRGVRGRPCRGNE
jgi:hypothetical protein